MAASPTTRVGFGILGAGNIAQIHAAAIQALPSARLVGFHATQPARAEALAARFGGIASTDLDAFLSHPDLDAVTICTPSGTHAELGQRAAAAGKHVIVEKPIDVTLAKAEALIAACRRHGVRLGVIFQSRFLPAVALLRRAIQRGRLGRIFVADAHVKWFREPAYYEAARWRGTRALDGGGALINQAIHTVDLLQHLAGPVAEVTGFTARLRHPGIECEDTAVAALKFHSGALGLLQATTSVAPGFARRLELSGERGTVILDGNDISVWKLDGTGEEEAELERLRRAARDTSDGAADPMRLDVAGHRAQLEDFVAVVTQGREPIVTGAEALKALAIVLAVYESAASGRPIAPHLHP